MVSMDSGNAHIAAMLGVKLSHFGCSSLCRFFTVPSAFRKYFGFRQGTISHATHLRLWKIVVGYEDAMRTITQEMVMSVKQLED
jgi:hypothetical protein